MRKKQWRKAALALSACLFLVWWALGTGATLAWFSDTDSVRNEFRTGLLRLEVSYKNDIVSDYTPLQGATEAFCDEALYEPGFTQVVYLKIENKGNVDFNYKTSVTVEGSTVGRNAWGEDIYLPDYLCCGMVYAETEAALMEQVSDRLTAGIHAEDAWGALDTWSEESPYTFRAGAEPHYAALIVRMPEEVDNAANYRGITEPQVELGITVFAQQANVDIQ